MKSESSLTRNNAPLLGHPRCPNGPRDFQRCDCRRRRRRNPTGARTVRHNAVDADLVRRELDREGARHVDDTGLRRSISDPSKRPIMPEVEPKLMTFRRALVGPFAGGNVLGDEVRAFETNRDNFVEFRSSLSRMVAWSVSAALLTRMSMAPKPLDCFPTVACTSAVSTDVAAHEHRFLAIALSSSTTAWPRPSCISAMMIFRAFGGKEFLHSPFPYCACA